MNNLIKCPYCNYQYLPGEIYDPKSFLGQPKNIVRNQEGEILGFEGIKSNLEESYICDNCDKEFIINAKITFSTSSSSGDIENTIEQEEFIENKQIGLFD